MRILPRIAIGVSFIFSLLCSSVALADSFPAVQVYEKTSKSVVLIVAINTGKSGMVGAGSIIDRSGLILTCAHVVMSKESTSSTPSIHVFLKPDKVAGDFRRDLSKRYEASVIVVDESLDLAVIKVHGLPKNIEHLELANPIEIRIGEEVIAIGHPEQGGLWSLTYGRISGEIEGQMNITGKDVYQTDTSVNRGNSGGPILDRRGYIVGVNANMARLGAGNTLITGVNFAIKSAVVKRWLDEQGYKVAYGIRPMEEEITVPSDTDTTKSLGRSKPEIAVPPKSKAGEENQPDVFAKPVDEKTGGESNRVPLKKSAENHAGETATDRILTPIKPYRADDVFLATEKEMEEMMEEIRRKINKQ